MAASIASSLSYRYDKTTRPVKDDNTTITVNVAISLYHILDTVSTRCDTLSLCAMITN